MVIRILDTIKSKKHPTHSFGIVVPTQDVSELVEGIQAKINLRLPFSEYSGKGYGGSVCFYRQDAPNLTSVTPIAVTMQKYSPNDASGNVYAAFGQDVTEIKFKAVFKKDQRKVDELAKLLGIYSLGLDQPDIGKLRELVSSDLI